MKYELKTHIDETVIQDAVYTFGEAAQIIKTIEELNELATELARWLNGDDNGDAILEEKGDVRITLDQMDVIFGDSNDWIEKKMKRLEGMLRND